MATRLTRAQRRFTTFTVIVVLTSILLLPIGAGLTQEVPSVPVTPQTTETEALSPDGLFFADIVVRGQPVFQVGSVGDVSATDNKNLRWACRLYSQSRSF
ncbi:hypothetical protein [Chlorogloeopsis fritschii]|uniref:hypothetical protein n=1 Tax=Chlorogloeopsis fritschii TaxID=1124 RepID=UPI0023F24E4A|nr:hypothetical protein [Chlorogloeopsis fritschii]